MDKVATDRLERFRRAIARLDPTRPLKTPGEHDLYVSHPGGLAARLGATLLLEPASTHVVIGSIGCGKSTEVLALERNLVDQGGAFLRYVDAGEHVELHQTTAHGFAAAITTELAAELSKRNYFFPGVKASLDAVVAGWRHGEEHFYEPDYEPEGMWSAPAFQAPKPVPDAFGDVVQVLEDCRIAVESRQQHLIWVIDGLDRLSDLDLFEELVAPLLQVVKRVRLGLVLIGPRTSMMGPRRLGVMSQFEDRHSVGPLDPSDHDGAGRAFLRSVLRQRGGEDLLDEDVVDLIAERSGGVLRHLVQLCRHAIREAFVRNASRVEVVDVATAADQLGRDLMLGLSDEEVDILTRLQGHHPFASRTANDEALIRSNRILEYRRPTGAPFHRVHPCLERFLEAQP